MKKFIKKNLTTILLLLVFLAGLLLLLYPSVSNWWNTNYSSHMIQHYTSIVSNLDQEKQEEILQEASAYNEELAQDADRYHPSDEMHEEYESLLNVDGSGMMGTLYIPSIRVNLPIYHTTSDNSLSAGIGHLEGSSLPVGGKGTHAVLTGHRGLPSARLLSDLDQVQIGDTFEITILNKTLYYEVDQILIVYPSQMDSLDIDADQDYVTLVTCTPYGINSHRLLVRGHRIDSTDDLGVSADAALYDNKIIAPFYAIPLLILLVIIIVFKTRKKKA
jgi:sortase A